MTRFGTDIRYPKATKQLTYLPHPSPHYFRNPPPVEIINYLPVSIIIARQTVHI